MNFCFLSLLKAHGRLLTEITHVSFCIYFWTYVLLSPAVVLCLLYVAGCFHGFCVSLFAPPWKRSRYWSYLGPEVCRHTMQGLISLRALDFELGDRQLTWTRSHVALETSSLGRVLRGGCITSGSHMAPHLVGASAPTSPSRAFLEGLCGSLRLPVIHAVTLKLAERLPHLWP